MQQKRRSAFDPPDRTGAPTARGAPECAQCGAPAVVGLAQCPHCSVAYAGVPPGAKCPGCGRLNASRRVECASCRHDLTRPCEHCEARSPLELVACWRCHKPFGAFLHAEGAGGARPGPTTAHDPCHVFSALDDILKS